MRLFANVGYVLLVLAANIVRGALWLASHWTKIIVTLSLIFGLTMVYELAMFRIELQDFRNSVVYDIDKVRAKMIEEMSYSYYWGCRTGIDYPQEYRDVKFGFNPNSPTSWCNERREKEWMDYIYQETNKVGRK